MVSGRGFFYAVSKTAGSLVGILLDAVWTSEGPIPSLRRTRESGMQPAFRLPLGLTDEVFQSLPAILPKVNTYPQTAPSYPPR